MVKEHERSLTWTAHNIEFHLHGFLEQGELTHGEKTITVSGLGIDSTEPWGTFPR